MESEALFVVMLPRRSEGGFGGGGAHQSPIMHNMSNAKKIAHITITIFEVS